MSRVVVITGATKGIGLAMAEGFLTRGARVAVCGRDAEAVRATVDSLAKKHGPDRIVGTACDVTKSDDLRALFELTRSSFSRVDVWINNAGTSSPQVDFIEQAPEVIAATVQTNLLGTMLGSHVAIEGMRKQGFGALYNMEGFGSDGSRQSGMSTYGSTKVAVRYFTRSLAAELRRTPILVCTLSPGVVVTDLLLDVYQKGDPRNYRKARRLFQFIADRADVVGPWLCDAVLANQKTDVRLAWMTVPKAILRFFMPSYHTRNIFPDDPRDERHVRPR